MLSMLDRLTGVLDGLTEVLIAGNVTVVMIGGNVRTWVAVAKLAVMVVPGISTTALLGKLSTTLEDALSFPPSACETLLTREATRLSPDMISVVSPLPSSPKTLTANTLAFLAIPKVCPVAVPAT
jgi:hypothetical protein